MKGLIAAAAVAVCLLPACGTDNTGSSKQPTEPEFTDAEATATFEDWRIQRASRLGDDETSVSIDNVECEVTGDLAARCTERITVDNLYIGKQVQDLVWVAEYTSEDKLGYAELASKAGGGNASSFGSTT